MSATPPNAYTDAPPQHPGLLTGALQLLFWMLLHPSAWRHHVARIDPRLGPDFALLDLSEPPWRSRLLSRLLFQLCLMLPLLSAAAVWAVLALARRPGPDIAYGVAFALSLGVVAGLPASVVGGVVVGSAVANFCGLAFGIGFGLSNNLSNAIELGFVHGLVAGLNSTEGHANPAVGSVLCGLAFGLAANLFATQWGRPGLPRPYSISRRVSGVVAGVGVGLGAGLIAYAVSTALAGAVISSTLNTILAGAMLGMAGSLAGSVAGLVRGGLWQRVRLYSLPGVTAFGAVVGLLFLWPVASAPVLLSAAVYGLTAAIIFSLLTAAIFGLPMMLAQRIAGPWAGAIAAIICAGGFWMNIGLLSLADPLFLVLLGVLANLLALTLHLWRPLLLYPSLVIYNLLLLRLDMERSSLRPALLRYHAAFWDEHQRLRWPGLDEHVVLVAQRSPAEGRQAIEYLANSRSQRWAAQAAQIELEARALEQCRSVAEIAAAHEALAAGELEGPASALLRSFSGISEDVEAALRHEMTYNQRLALSRAEERIDGLLRELTRSSERYALRFRPIAARWRELVAAQIRDLATVAEQRQEIDNPYVIGVPLSAEQEIFVGRTDISARIEQLLLDRRRPPLLLYGQRRMGKTSLLNNLGRLLPSTVVPLFVDLQGPVSRASSEAGFLYYLAKSMGGSAMRQRGLALPELDRETIERDPFIVFDEWLVTVERLVGNGTGLLILDEFEVLDRAIQRGRFDEERILGMLRHIIQHRPRLKVLLAGSHGLDEFRRWSSYLINVQVVHISYLGPGEARKLIEQPVKDFELRYTPAASERVLALTRGHPFLVQLLCAEIVALKNERATEQRRLAEPADVEAAVDSALASGDMFFADILHNQLDAHAGELLRRIAAAGECAVVAPADLAPHTDKLQDAIGQLVRRELIELCDGGYRVQVELIRRWFTR